MLKRKKFYRFISNYKPIKYEELSEKDSRYDLKNKLNYAIISRRRFYFSLKYSLDCITKKEAKILDIGAYPGTFLRILQEYFCDYKLDLYGAGMNMKPDFVEIMKSKNIKTLTVNLDPSNEQLKNKNYSNSIDLEDGSIDFVSALEIIEHFSSPFHMLAEAKRILKKGGKILITTPNITRIGSAFKLLFGRTNLDTIASPGDYDEDNEWRLHTYEYSMKELSELMTKAGFKVEEKIFFNSNVTHFNVKSKKQQLVDLIKLPFYLNPYWRENLLIVAGK